MTDLESIKQTLTNISKGNNLLDILMEFERTLDNVELFGYKNWLLGEIVEGPSISRYYISITLMYPYSKMPDPDGGLRLRKIGANVSFKKGTFKRPVKVKGPEDWLDPVTKRAKMLDTKVWLVTIEMPIKYINRGLEHTDDVIAKDIERSEQELNDAYEAQIPDSEEQSSVDISGAPQIDNMDQLGQQNQEGNV